MDGRVEEAAWEDAQSIALPWEVHPTDNGPAPVATECRIAYDEEALYLGCRASDPEPERIRAFYTDRDATSGHDKLDPVSVVFVGYGDLRDASVGPDLEERPLGPRERSFFLKLGYGWRP